MFENRKQNTLFETGEIEITSFAKHRLYDENEDVQFLLERHRAGDWGRSIGRSDRQNNESCLNGTNDSFYLHSHYTLGNSGGIAITTYDDPQTRERKTIVETNAEYVMRISELRRAAEPVDPYDID